MKPTSRGGGWLKHLAVELFIHLETWIQQEENPNPECACWEGQGVMCESARSRNASARGSLSGGKENLPELSLFMILFEEHSELEEGE